MSNGSGGEGRMAEFAFLAMHNVAEHSKLHKFYTPPSLVFALFHSIWLQPQHSDPSPVVLACGV